MYYMSPNAPMTEEQLEFFTHQTARAVRKATSKFAVAASVGYLILFGGVFAMYENGQSVSDKESNAVVQSGRAVAVSGCNRDFKDRKSFRALFERLIVAVDASVERGDATPAQGRFAKKFYQDELDKLPLFDCRDAEKVITDNPGRTARIPTPLHP